eukprot:3026189-Rhodomonas_salina.1
MMTTASGGCNRDGMAMDSDQHPVASSATQQRKLQLEVLLAQQQAIRCSHGQTRTLPVDMSIPSVRLHLVPILVVTTDDRGGHSLRGKGAWGWSRLGAGTLRRLAGGGIPARGHT